VDPDYALRVRTGSLGWILWLGGIVSLGGIVWLGRQVRAAIAAAVLVAVLAALGAPGLAPGLAVGAPKPRQRVVLADPDPELRHAMDQALAPYHLAVVIEGAAPADAAMAQERADGDTARFVVWRDGAQLVVYDRELGTTERRASQAGVLDAPTAAAAALTIKTMMRLPPPPTEPALEAVSEAAPVAARPPEPSGIALRVQAGIASRIARGDDTVTSARLGGAVALQPSRRLGFRIGVAGDAGSGTDVDRASFKGTWRDWSVLGFVSWSFGYGAWEIEPHIGAGARISTLDGDEMKTPRGESAALATVRGGAWLRWRYARFTVGATISVDEVFGTPTYTKTDTPAEVFQVPGGAIELGGVIAVDL
jgi:hypothetical protein